MPGSVDAQGNRSPLGAPWGVYPCAGDDQWCVITVRDDAEWSAFASVDRESRSGRPIRASRRSPTATLHHDELDESRQLVDVAARGARGDASSCRRCACPRRRSSRPRICSTIRTSRPHDFVRVILQPDWEPLFVEGDCYRADELVPAAVGGPAPRHGEHTRDIAAELLGLDDEEVDRLIAAGVLEVDTE